MADQLALLFDVEPATIRPLVELDDSETPEPTVSASAPAVRLDASGVRWLLPGSLAAGAPAYVTLGELRQHYERELEQLEQSGAKPRHVAQARAEIDAELAAAGRWLDGEQLRRRAEHFALLDALAATIEAEHAARAGAAAAAQKASA